MCSSRGRAVTRRGFVKGCAAGLAFPVLGTDAGEPERQKVRVALVFLSRRGSSWPSPTFDVAKRESEVLGLLRKGCPEIELVPVAVRTTPPNMTQTPLFIS